MFSEQLETRLMKNFRYVYYVSSQVIVARGTK
jgi:hypothetical protein